MNSTEKVVLANIQIVTSATLDTKVVMNGWNEVLVINVKWFLITMGILVFVVFGLILICRFIDRKFMKKENKNERPNT